MNQRLWREQVTSKDMKNDLKANYEVFPNILKEKGFNSNGKQECHLTYQKLNQAKGRKTEL